MIGIIHAWVRKIRVLPRHAWRRIISEIKAHPASFHLGNSASLFMASMITLIFGGWEFSLAFFAGGILTLEMAFIEFQKLRPRQRAKKSGGRR